MRSAALLALATLATAQPALAQQAMPDAAPACYALPEGEHPEIASLSIDELGQVALTVTGAPFMPFEFTCAFDDEGKAHCGVDCDGGNLYLEKGPDGITADFQHLRFEDARVESIVFGQVQFDADGYAFSGRYTLPPADPSACDAAAHAQPYDLRPGDFFPAVLRLERALVTGGYLTEAPDWYYTTETGAAVAAFQAEVGLPVTGRADAEVLRRLAVFTGYAYGGC